MGPLALFSTTKAPWCKMKAYKIDVPSYAKAREFLPQLQSLQYKLTKLCIIHTLIDALSSHSVIDGVKAFIKVPFNDPCGVVFGGRDAL